ncbi:hypothetical protein B0H14DRAFT_3499961 [Mycena olivaceomarginata]|nr:hypothetical protein B0H14DRAFT_3499961 [Mycena olivaceomarginata]
MKQEDVEIEIPKPRWAGPPSTIIGDPPGFHTDAERSARIRLVLKQREDLEGVAGLGRVLAHISLLKQVNDGGRSQRAREHRQRARAWQLLQLQGERAVRSKPLTEDELYLDEARPDEVCYPPIMNTCGICLNVKSHPVRLSCGHSTCYVCVRILLETQWGCPQCSKNITRKPEPDFEEAAAIERKCGAWDMSRVEYNWDGLRFPRTERDSLPMADFNTKFIGLNAKDRPQMRDRGERNVNMALLAACRSPSANAETDPNRTTASPVHQCCVLNASESVSSSSACALVPAVPNTWTPEAQAAWEARWKDLGAMFLQERTEGLTECNDEDSAVDDGDIEKARQWDMMVTQLVDAMPAADRREWLQEQRLQEEWTSRLVDAPAADRREWLQEEWTSRQAWSDSNARQYIDC